MTAFLKQIQNKLKDIDKRTIQLFLSHHLEGEYDRCLNLPFGSRHWRICSRCTGVYAGIILGIIASLMTDMSSFIANTVILIFPLPAFIDFYLNQADIYSGTNFSRVSTGIMLGFMYSITAYSILTSPLELVPYIAILGYGILTLLLINKNR